MPPKKATVPKKATTTKTTRVTKAKATDDSVVALATSVGETLILRANPSDGDVRRFVEEHTRRYVFGEAGGPSGIPPFRIFTAERFVSELAWINGDPFTATIDIEDLVVA